MSLIKHILDKNLTEANEALNSTFSQIVEKKMWEMKKAISAKMECWSADGAAPRPYDPHERRMRKLDSGVLEEDEESGEESSMARSELQAMTKDAKNIMSKVKGNRELEAWVQSKITKAADYMNSVSDYMDGNKEKVNEEADPLEKNLPVINQTGGSQERSEKLASMARGQPAKAIPPTQADKEKATNLEEARIKLIKARIRGGKVQRRVKKSNVPGMRLQGGQLKRMTAAERRARRLGAKRAKIKRKAHMTQTLMKRKRSLVKRQRLGI